MQGTHLSFIVTALNRVGRSVHAITMIAGRAPLNAFSPLVPLQSNGQMRLLKLSFPKLADAPQHMVLQVHKG